MSILKYVTKQPSRKLKDHNLELPNADLPNSGVSSRACTTMPDAETISSLPAQMKLPACTIMPHPDTSTPYAETGSRASSSTSHLPSSSSLVGLSCFPAPIQLPACTTMASPSLSKAQNSVEAKYRIIYCEVIDYTVNAIQRRFDQDGYKVLCKLEELLCDPKCKLNECNEILDLYGQDFDLERLAIQLSVLHCNLPFEVHSQTGGMKLKSIIQYLQQLTSSQRQLLHRGIEACKIYSCNASNKCS